MNTIKHNGFLSYVIPSVLAFALSGIYTIVDGFFIGNSLGDIGLASITLGYPVTALIQAIGTGIGLSGAIRFTILKAQGKTQKQQACFGGTTLLMLLVSGLVTALIFLFLYPLLRLLGAEGAALELTADYIRIIALGTVFQLLATGFVPFIRNMGGAAFAMAAMILGFITNIILDYSFVWVGGWGMAGAAWATVIGQAVTMSLAILFFAIKKMSFRLPGILELAALWKVILTVSVAPFGLTFSPTITLLLMNRFLLLYGSEQSIAVYGCIGYVTSIIYLLLQGVGDGSQPLISQYYGEDNMAAVKQTRRLTYITAFAITFVCVIGLFLARWQVGVLFGASAEANQEVGVYLPLFLATMAFLAYVRVTTAYFYATEKTRLSYILVYAEPLFSLLFLLVLPRIFNLRGVWLAVPLAQLFAWCISVAAKH